VSQALPTFEERHRHRGIGGMRFERDKKNAKRRWHT
jgi:hypothetical protein